MHRKLNLCAGSIAQTKKRMPHRRTQESFASGTASVHAESVISPVRDISVAAGTTETQMCDLYHGERRAKRRTLHMLHSTNGAVQVSVPNSPTSRLCPCNLSFCSFFAAAGRSTGVLFLAVQLRRMLRSCAVGASLCFEARNRVRCKARLRYEMDGWAADHADSHHPSFGLDSPTCRLHPCNPSFRSFFASTGRSTGVLFLAVQLRRMLQSCAVGAFV